MSYFLRPTVFVLCLIISTWDLYAQTQVSKALDTEKQKYKALAEELSNSVLPKNIKDFELLILGSNPGGFNNPSDTAYHSPSYVKLRSLDKGVLNKILDTEESEGRDDKQLLAGEYYTQLKTGWRYRDELIFGQKCGTRAPGNWYLTVTLNMTYHGNKLDNPIPILKDQVFMAGGNDANKNCTFKALPPGLTIHSLLYTGFPQEQGEYRLIFDVQRGEMENQSAFALVAKIAGFASKFFPVVGIPAAIISEAPPVAAEVDKLLDREYSKFTVTSQYHATLTAARGPSESTIASRLLKNAGSTENVGQLTPAVSFLLKVTSPLIATKYGKEKFEEFGAIEIYSSRSASLIIDSAVDGTDILLNAEKRVPIKASWILGQPSLGTSRRCFPAPSGCKVSLRRGPPCEWA